MKFYFLGLEYLTVEKLTDWHSSFSIIPYISTETYEKLRKQKNSIVYETIFSNLFLNGSLLDHQITNNIEESDFLIYPYKLNDGIKNYLDVAKKYNKKIITFYFDDDSLPFDIPPEIILFRSSINKSLKKNNERCLPYIAPDQKFTNSTPKEKIGFVGRNNMLELTLGILTYNAPKTLEKTLNSLFYENVNSFFKEIILYINPSSFSEENVNLANNFNIKYELAKENKWIGTGFKWIVENAISENVLLLEDDFSLIEKDKEKIFKILNSAIHFLKNKEVDVVKLRSRKNAGNPLYSSWFAGQEHKCMTHLAECIHWKENPELDFPEHCQKISEDPVWYKFSSKNSNFTNNPCIYRKKFYKKHIIPNYCIDFTDIETLVTDWWASQDFKVISGDGLFCHDRLDGK